MAVVHPCDWCPCHVPVDVEVDANGRKDSRVSIRMNRLKFSNNEQLKPWATVAASY